MEFSENVAFERGMRSEHTPLRSAPVGAFVVVQVEPQTGKIMHVRSVHSHTAFTATEGSDLYFVVNDCKSEKPHQGQLTLQVAQKRSSVSETQVGLLMEILADMSSQMEIHLRHYLNEAEISGAETVAVQNQLETLVQEKLTLSEGGLVLLNDLPLMGEWIHNWIHSEVTQLERRIRIRQAERKIHLLFLKHRDLVNQRFNHAQSQFMNALITDWNYMNLDYQSLSVGIERVVNYLNYRVLPIYHTVNPLVLQRSSQELREFVRGMTLDTDPSTLAQALLSFMDHLNFEVMMNLTPKTHSGQLVVSIPKPTRYKQVNQNGSVKYQAESIWSTVSHLEAERFWADIEQNLPQVQMTIHSNDLYHPEVFSGTLQCTERAPFVKGMSIFFVVDDEEGIGSLNYLHPRLPILLPEFVQIPNSGGLEHYRVPESYRSDIVPIRFSTASRAFETVVETRTLSIGAAKGISPVGTFTLSGMNRIYGFLPASTLLNQVLEVLVVFDYESLSSPQGMPWIPHCSGHH